MLSRPMITVESSRHTVVKASLKVEVLALHMSRPTIQIMESKNLPSPLTTVTRYQTIST